MGFHKKISSRSTRRVQQDNGMWNWMFCNRHYCDTWWFRFYFILWTNGKLKTFYLHLNNSGFQISVFGALQGNRWFVVSHCWNMGFWRFYHHRKLVVRWLIWPHLTLFDLIQSLGIEIWLKTMMNCNGSQLKNPDISGATTTLSLSILILNYQCVEGARDFRVL